MEHATAEEAIAETKRVLEATLRLCGWDMRGDAMTHFEHLRQTPWQPQFKWVGTQYEAADYINRPHEDYPKRCWRTESVIESAQTVLRLAGNPPEFPAQADLISCHDRIFHDESFRGRYRDLNVTVGPHRPPPYQRIQLFMDQLSEQYKGTLITIKELVAWYTDFETIHPFQDGNGRVGGVIVAVLSHQMHPEKGWLTPLQ